MAVTLRTAALTIITAAAVGAGAWGAVRVLSRPSRGPVAAAPSQARQPNASRRIKATLYYVAADGLRLVVSTLPRIAKSRNSFHILTPSF